ncbi:MAG: redox-sensing transcriptional repressor Rex [Candidatus Brocadiae bacterium]|nr:redox-sensing transcriptional repressor Rex [Candidatus Brocadiia bacterium]
MNVGNLVKESLKAIPEPTLRRLPIYHQYLKKIDKEDFISCTTIANDLCLEAIQVRKDISLTGIVGKPQVGYSVKQLMSAIEDFLGWNNVMDAFLVGVGSLGSAILGYKGFEKYGLNILAGFDVDDSKVGTEIHRKKIYHIEKLPSLIKRMKIKIGILTLPASCAQEIANTMVEAGIKALWNFSPIKITTREEIIVLNENLAASLAVLSKKLQEQQNRN